MSIQKSIIAALCVHALAAGLTWVGFPVPVPKGGVEFLYSGAFMPAEELSGGAVMEKNSREQALFPAGKAFDAGVFPPWVRMRNLDKPKQ